MLLKIENLGVVKEAQIDLGKDLILLCGQNNTGKTYVNTAIYSLLNYHFDIKPNKLIKKMVETLLQGQEYKLDVNSQEFFDYCDDVTKQLAAQQKDFTEQIIDSFAANKKLFAKTRFSLEYQKYDYKIPSYGSGQFEQSLTLDEQKEVAYIIETSDNIITIRLKEVNNFEEKYREKFEFEFTILIYAFRSMAMSIAKIHFFPAQRSAINIFATELSLIKNKVLEAALKDNSLLELAKKRTNRYSKPIKDNLETAQDLLLLSQEEGEFEALAQELENSILKGKIIVSKYGSLLYIPHDNPKIQLEMHQSSSLVESLAMLVFCLRHIAMLGDCIIIDEPELNLHPDNQILVARFLGRMVNAGLKLIVSTHSNFIVRELNNLIMLSQKNKKTVQLKRKYGYFSEKKNQTLNPKQVGAYLFRVGESCISIPVDETGFNVDTIDETNKKLNESSQDIYFSLFD